MYDAIKAKIANGETLHAINQMINFLKERDVDISNELILLSARQVNSARNQKLDLISFEEASRAGAQISFALLGIIERIKQKGLFVHSEEEAGGPTDKETTRIIFFEANPLDQKLFSSNESRDLSNIFRHHPNKNKFIFQKEFAVDQKLFLQIVNDDRPDIIHISAFANEEKIILHDENDAPKEVSNELLVTIFDLFNHPVHCTFFNTWISKGIPGRYGEAF